MSNVNTKAMQGAAGFPDPVASVAPIILAAPGRGEDLPVRVSAPVTGHGLPIIAFSHGYGKSLDAYAPLVQFWAAHGFVVVQTTHLDSRRLAIPADDPRTPSIWRTRVEDMVRMLDSLELLAQAIPGLADRIDHRRIAAVGHSYGAQTAGLMLGARIFAADGSLGPDMSDPRITAGVLLAATGQGGKDLSAFAAEHFPSMNPSFAEMTRPVLVVAGDRDDSPLSSRGPDWFTDAYTESTGDKSLLTLFGGEHLLGGISGFEAKETTDENPARVAAVQQLTSAYLHSALNPADDAWPVACADLAKSTNPQGRVESK